MIVKIYQETNEQKMIFDNFKTTLKKSNPYLLVIGIFGMWTAGTMFGFALAQVYIGV